MNKFYRYTLIAIGLNLVLIILCLLPVFLTNGHDGLAALLIGFFLVGLSFLIQLIVGLVFISTEKNKIQGQAMLLAVGIILLIGFSWCGLVMN